MTRRKAHPAGRMAVVAGLALAASIAGAQAAEEGASLMTRPWPENGAFGTFDRAAVQRGFQVYKEVCHTCHSLNYFSFRDLAPLGFSEAEIAAIAAGYQVPALDDQGETVERPAKPFDKMPAPYPNPEAARAALGQAPPDLSLMVKAREDGQDYLYSLMHGYSDPPAGHDVPAGLNYNRYFPGGNIAMPQPLADGQVTYSDGTQASLDQMAADVTQFLHYVAEPKLEERKLTGFKAGVFLVVFAGIMAAYKRKVWKDVH